MRQPELTPRLQTVADLVPEGALLADIGTDHAYLPVWLLLEGRIRGAIAADLRKGPLERAMLTAQQYECTHRVSFRLCDGLSGIEPNEADAIVIAGMGGETIAAILEEAPWTRNKAYTFVLQPMSAQNILRRWLWQHGFSIQNEALVREGDKLYNIFVVRHGDAVPMTLGEEWAGRQYRELEQNLRGEYLRRLLEKTGRAMEGISRGKGERDHDRLEELRHIFDALTAMKEEWDTWHR